MIRSRILSAVAATAIAGGGLVAFTPQSAGAATPLVTCSGLTAIASLNPSIKSSNPAYVKAALKHSDGTKFQYLTNAPVPVDATACFVDAGIRTNQGGQDVKYILDDQSNGNALLTRAATAAPDGIGVAVTTGSATCNTTDAGVIAASVYPNTYPLQGKTVWKFEQLGVTGAQIQIQQYLRTGRDNADPDAQDITVKGIVIKGPGVGGDVAAVLNFFPTNSATKNLNVLECLDANIGDDALNASLAELIITQSDGSDVGAAVDDWTISLP